MALIELVRPCDSQPQEWADVNQSAQANPDVGLWLPPLGLLNAATGSALAMLGSGVRQETGQGGLAYAIAGQSISGSATGSLDTGITETPSQLWFVVQFVSFDAPSAAGYGSPFHKAQYAINWHHADSNYRGAVSLYVGGSYPRVSLIDKAANKVHTVVANWDGATLSVWQNGAFCGSVAAPGALGSGSAALRLLAASGGEAWNGQLFLAAMGRRAIATAVAPVVAAAISAQPWHLLQRREFIPVQVAGDGGITGTSSGTLSLTGAAVGSVLVSGASTETLALSGTATGTVGATGVTGASAGTLSLSGTATAAVSVSGQSAGTIALSGTAAASARVTGASSATIGLTGTATGTTTGAISGASAGVLSLSGTASGSVRVSSGSAAVLQISGEASAQIVVRGVSAGLLSMTGSATGLNAGSGGDPNGETPPTVRASLRSRSRLQQSTARRMTQASTGRRR